MAKQIPPQLKQWHHDVKMVQQKHPNLKYSEVLKLTSQLRKKSGKKGKGLFGTIGSVLDYVF